jgi:polysaccharide deacetylase family protein (PEP-CTERM system associated)
VNILTFDIEDWFHILDNASSRTEEEWASFAPRLEQNADRLLDLLTATGVRATFFCLGWVAEKHPSVIKQIHAAGYEIGSHSYRHQLVYEQSRGAFRHDLQASLGRLEDLTGTKIRAYRAPGFSITRSNTWAFEVLAEHGIEVDSSVFPASRAHGGFAGFGAAQPTMVEHAGVTLKEFPINTYALGGRQLIFSGGGYFRLLPYPVIRRMMAKSPYVMTYFHPRDFDPDQPMLPGLRWHRVFKSYYGLRSAFDKLRRLLNEFDFVDLRTAEGSVDWQRQPVVKV